MIAWFSFDRSNVTKSTSSTNECVICTIVAILSNQRWKMNSFFDDFHQVKMIGKSSNDRGTQRTQRTFLSGGPKTSTLVVSNERGTHRTLRTFLCGGIKTATVATTVAASNEFQMIGELKECQEHSVSGDRSGDLFLRSLIHSFSLNPGIPSLSLDHTITLLYHTSDDHTIWWPSHCFSLRWSMQSYIRLIHSFDWFIPCIRLIDSFTWLKLIRSFTWFAHWFAHWFIHSLVWQLVIDSLIQILFTDSFIRSLIHSFVHWFIQPTIDSLIQISFSHWFIDTFSQFVHWFCPR